MDSGQHEPLTLIAVLVISECEGYEVQWMRNSTLYMSEAAKTHRSACVFHAFSHFPGSRVTSERESRRLWSAKDSELSIGHLNISSKDTELFLTVDVLLAWAV